MYFRPRLANGQFAHVSWQIRLLYISIVWPFDDDGGDNDDSKKWRLICLDWFRKIVGLLTLAITAILQLGFLVDKSDNMLLMLNEMSKFVVVFDVFMRTTNVVLNNKQFKGFLKEFYARFYISKFDDTRNYNEIERYLLPIVIYSYSYIIAILFTLTIPLVGLFSSQRLLVFNLWLPCDMSSLYIYLPTLVSNYWINLAGIACIVGESNLMATIVLHLNARFKLLQQEIQDLYVRVLEQDLDAEDVGGSLKIACHLNTIVRHHQGSQTILSRYRQGLATILKRNVELKEFASKLRAIYSFRIFVMLGLSAINLCVIGFTVATHEVEFSFVSPITPYIIFAIAKIVELIVLGELGSRLYESTNVQSSVYYLSNWENIILRSMNSLDNNQLMKLIVLSIELNREPITLTGMNFFSLSLKTSISILQGAFSYFTCLYALR